MSQGDRERVEVDLVINSRLAYAALFKPRLGFSLTGGSMVMSGT